MVRGYQENEPPVLACVKHFALYGAPMGGRDYHTVDMSRRAMVETYLPPYRAAIDAGARTVMTAFNEIDGIPASGNRGLLTGLLREQWKFQGWIVTDYTAVTEMKNHGTAASDADAAKQSLDAGSGHGHGVGGIPAGAAGLGEIRRSAGGATRCRGDARAGDEVGSGAFRGCLRPLRRGAGGGGSFAARTHRELAREAARESVVLLKNDSPLLPLAKQGKDRSHRPARRQPPGHARLLDRGGR
jgi:beta-glucosidase